MTEREDVEVALSAIETFSKVHGILLDDDRRRLGEALTTIRQAFNTRPSLSLEAGDLEWLQARRGGADPQERRRRRAA